VTLMDQFPGDRGAFCPFLLKCLALQPGEAFFMGAGQPHAYVSGDCLEVMALSDNVIRAALTPKFKDIDTLYRAVDFSGEGGTPIVHPIKIDDETVVYRPPINVCPEFELSKSIFLKANHEDSNTISLPELPCGSLILIFDGQCEMIASDSSYSIRCQKGSVILVPANTQAMITLLSDEVVIFRSNMNMAQ
jgi:mannose-6-phosphate isomerase